MIPEGPRTRALLARRRRRRQRLFVVAGVFAVTALLGVAALAYLDRSRPRDPVADPPASATAAPTAAGPAPSFPVSGPNSFSYAPGSDQVSGAGAADPKRYRVAVEDGSGQDPAGFATAVGRILGDPRGWIAGGDVRFQQVPKDAANLDFTIMLATQATSEKLCSIGGVHTDQYSSCRLPGQLIINLTRWQTGIPGYGAPLDEYRAYEINYAVGRELGHGNEACPNPGTPAPVMQKQVLGLKGCTANGWPYRDGGLYSGPAVP
jgi:Protein of unknown function (DUF3152)